MKHKKTTIAIISVIALALVIIGVTYAYWVVTRTQQKQNTISTGCLDIDLTNEKNDITLEEAFPTSDEDGMKLTPYEFTITNKCDSAVDYQVALETIGDESKTVIASAIKVALDDEITLLGDNEDMEPTYVDAFAAKKLTMGTLQAYSEENEDDSVTYNLRLWIDADAPISEMNKTFESKITVSVGQGIYNPYKEGTLAYDIVSNYGGLDAITKLTDFNIVTAGLYKTKDNLGDTYYFRGDVKNNYVQFGSYAAGSTVNGVTYDVDTPIYWRIVRVNGDGTIRLLYDGTSLVENGVAHSAVVGSSSALAVLNSLNEWYKNYLETLYGNYIFVSHFCEDDSGDAEDRINNYTPTLICSSYGNKLKSQSVGTLSADEALYIGENYLGSNDSWWTLTKASEEITATSTSFLLTRYEYAVDITGKVSSVLSYDVVDDSQYQPKLGVRPVINLKADVSFTGTGEIGSPYEIVMN